MTDPADFFAGLASDPRAEWLDEEQRRALADIRAALARAEPRCMGPEQASISDWHELELVIPHASTPHVRIELSFGDGYLALLWPGGREQEAWEWKPELASVVEALLSGRNRQYVYRCFGRVLAVDTEIWDEAGTRRRLTRGLALLGRILRPFASRTERSLSFDRKRAFEFKE